jgi:bromodomain adjacent to zinc finger domain protein 1A
VDGNPLSTVELYSRMQPQDKIAILSFLCDVSILSKSIRQYMEGCEEALTALRKEKTELNRERKRWQVIYHNKTPTLSLRL